MARTIAEIKRTMTDAFMTNATLREIYGLAEGDTFEGSFSAVSLESILFFIVAACCHVMEALFDRHRLDVDEKIGRAVVASVPWYYKVARQFQYGDALVFDDTTSQWRYPTADEKKRLVRFVADVDDPRVGICLDPANCVAGLELPGDVIDRCAPYTLNLHVKDFAFTRRDGWVGFTLAGAAMGEGLLDLGAELSAVRPLERGISMIVEHWLTWQGDPRTTVAMERRWTRQTLARVRSGLGDHIEETIEDEGEPNHE